MDTNEERAQRDATPITDRASAEGYIAQVTRTAPAQGVPVGYVAVRSASGVVLLHLAKPPNGDRTLCGRYTSDRYLPEDSDVSGARLCRVDEAIAAGTNNYRWRKP